MNVYGWTKLKGELAVSQTLEKYYIVRIAWVFGLNGKNFIKTRINVGKTYDEVRVVNDQIGTPTYTFDLARLLVDMCETEKYGYNHAKNSEVTYKNAGRKAARPFNSRLDKSKRFEPLATWQAAVRRYLKEAQL